MPNSNFQYDQNVEEYFWFTVAMGQYESPLGVSLQITRSHYITLSYCRAWPCRIQCRYMCVLEGVAHYHLISGQFHQCGRYTVLYSTVEYRYLTSEY